MEISDRVRRFLDENFQANANPSDREIKDAAALVGISFSVKNFTFFNFQKKIFDIKYDNEFRLL